MQANLLVPPNEETKIINNIPSIPLHPACSEFTRVSPSATTMEKASNKTRRRERTTSITFSDTSEDNHSATTTTTILNRSPRKKVKMSLVTHTSAFRGVSCCGKDRKFQARIRDGSKVHYLGRFDNEFDAAMKYDEAARSHKGDLAMPNFIEMTEDERQKLRNHYFENGHTILPEFQHYLFQGTSERFEMKRSSRKLLLSNNEEKIIK